MAVALKAVDAVDLVEVFALRSFADPNVLVLYGVLVAGSSDVATVAERPDAPLDVVLCGNPPPRVDSLRVARDMASALTFLHARSRAHAPGAVERPVPPRAAPALQGRLRRERFGRDRAAGAKSARARLRGARTTGGGAGAVGGRRAPRPVRVRRLGLRLRARRGSLCTAPWTASTAREFLRRSSTPPGPRTCQKMHRRRSLTLARECFARLATPRPAMGDVVARVEVLLEADYARGASAEQRLAKVEAAIEAEEASDRATYKEAWSCCTTASGEAIDRLLKLSESLAATYAATPRHAALARDAPVAELLDLAAEVGESVHATLKRVVTEAGGKYEEGPLKAKARIQQKRRSADYGGDLARVVDVVRGQGIFHDNQADAFEAALQGLVEGGADAASGEEAKDEEDHLVLVRVKDRLNTPVEKSGHRDVLINFEHELTAVRKTIVINYMSASLSHNCACFSHRLSSAQAHGLRRRAPTDVLRGLLDVKASAHRIYNISRAREDEDEAVAAVSEPSLRNSDVLSLVARGSSRPSARSSADRSRCERRSRALPRGLVVSAIYDGTGGAAKCASTSPTSRRSSDCARRRPRWIHRRKAPRGSRYRGGRPRRVRATPRDVAAPF